MNALKPRTPESYIIDLLRLINKYNLVVFVLTVYTEIHKVTTWVRFRCRFRVSYYTLKNAGLFQPKFGSNMDKPKCCVKNAIKMYS